MTSFRVAGLSFRPTSVSNLVVGTTVVFEADGADLRVMDGVVQFGFVPEKSIPSVNAALRDVGYQGASVSRISEDLSLVEGGGILVDLAFSDKAPEVVAECDCCVVPCGTLEFEDEKYRGDA